MKSKLLKTIKIFVSVCLVLCAVGVLVFAGVNIYVRTYAQQYILSEEQAKDICEFDCIVVLGAQVRADGTPSLMLESRLKKALQLYENGISEKMLMSGDHGRKNYDEVNNMMEYALENSEISKENVFLDHAGFSTYESAYRAKEIFDIDKAVFVTQKYHLYRAIYNARANGIEAYGVFSDDYNWPRISYYKLRESMAIFKDFWFCTFNIKPTYLGEKIPIDGSAVFSHDS